MKKPIPQYTEQKCECCGQTTTYASKVNKGMATFLHEISKAVQSSGKNDITMKDLLKSGQITHSQYDNRSHLRCHGFIASIGVNRYCLTKKGAAFLRGEPVEAVAIVEKKTHSNVGYLSDADGVIYMTTIKEIHRGKEGYWDGWNYEIINGEPIHKNSQTEQQSFI